MRRKLKQIALTVAQRALDQGSFRRVAGAFSGVGAVFMMHRVVVAKAESAAANLTVTTEFLDRTLSYLREQGVEFVTLAELSERLSGRRPSGRRMVALTFDDGYRDNLTLALPILRKHQIPATIFVPSGAPDRAMDIWFLRLEKAVMTNEALRPNVAGLPDLLPAGSTAEKCAAYQSLVRFVQQDLKRNRHVVESLLPCERISNEALMAESFASWAELRDAAADPLLTIGGHTVSHPVLSKLDGGDALAEMVTGRERLESELDRAIKLFAYPYGGRTECGSREFEMARRAAFDLAVTTRYDCVRPSHGGNLFALPRMTLGGLRESLDAVALDVFGGAAALRA
jgi:peptidoglycan/xylan/chitin deacetylase (PgdA/CDA1 family)